ncbi:MAG TPA: VOC family protein [Gammaproteobacteria bacterium]|nr:VOC family protein [Candidatus Hydrogenedentota bacterium]HJP35947.1 VOC family protein [Gammaproteobacteria bacterium]
MRIRMRQICLVAHDLDQVESDLTAVFGTRVCRRDPGVGKHGLHNFLMPFGKNFLEVVSPIEEGTTGGRYLDRRGGDGGYMVIMQTSDIKNARKRVSNLGIRLVADGVLEDTDGIQLHPKDLPGAIAELRWNEGDDDDAGPWWPAGPDWKPAVRTHKIKALTAAELQSNHPAALAARWSEALDKPVERDESGAPTIALADAALRFVEDEDGRGLGLGGLDVACTNRAAVLEAAEALGCRESDEQVRVCGMRFRLV